MDTEENTEENAGRTLCNNNLRPLFPKGKAGECGRPRGGRPKGSKSFSTLFKEMLALPSKIHDPNNPGKFIKNNYAIAAKMIDQAIDGRYNQQKEILDRSDGKVVEKRAIDVGFSKKSNEELLSLVESIVKKE